MARPCLQCGTAHKSNFGAYCTKQCKVIVDGAFAKPVKSEPGAIGRYSFKVVDEIAKWSKGAALPRLLSANPRRCKILFIRMLHAGRYSKQHTRRLLERSRA